MTALGGRRGSLRAMEEDSENGIDEARYWALKRQEDAALAQAAEAGAKEREAYCRTPQGRAEAAFKLWDHARRSYAENGGDEREVDELARAYYSAKEVAEAAQEAATEAEWTEEETRKRRREWNEWVRGCGLFTSSGKPVDGPAAAKAMFERQAEQGWTTGALQEAIKRHQL